MVKLVYHGSPHKFEEFSFKKVGTEAGIDGAGFGLYFSESKSDALSYGDNVYTCLLELTNNVSNTKVDFQEHILTSIYYDILKKSPKEYNTSNVEYFIRKLIRESKSDTQIIHKFIVELFDGYPDDMLEILTKKGYTHTIDKETPEDKTITHYIVYDLNAIAIMKKETLEDME